MRTEPDAFASDHAPLRDFAGGPPRESLRTPAIGDIDGDREPEIVASAGEHVYAWNEDGTPVAGFPVGVDRGLSEPCKEGVPKPCFNAGDRAITSANHIKRGIFGSVALADLDGDGALDITVGAMDQHVYAWDGSGHALDGFPAKVASDGADGAEIVNSPAIAQLDGTGPPEIVIATNEVIPGDPAFPTSPFDIFSAALGSTTGSNPVYALHGDGTPVDGWPVKVGVAAGDLLPLVLPGHDAAVLDSNGDGSDEVSVSAGTSLAAGGGVRLVDGDGSTVTSYENAAPDSPDPTMVLNLADYASVGDITGAGPDVIKGGLTLNGAANLLAVNQNLPFSHVVQAWDPTTGTQVPGFPRATDDYQLVSQPAIARVGGSGPGHQALYGTGLYQLHAYGTGGLEPAGWPKFTGGWTQATPSVGDVDGDGRLDISAVTREGWSFLWKTNVDACDDSNDEWWTFHHDEFGSANYGTDSRPPGTPGSLAAKRRAGGAFRLRWRAPGDDWMCGTADRYEVRLSPDPIDDPSDGTKLARAGSDPKPSGGGQVLDLRPSDAAGNRYAAVLYRDDAGNWGRLASVKLPAALQPPPPPAACETVLAGTAAADVLRGTAVAEMVRGKAGNDTIKAGGGDDCIDAGAGSDRVHGNAGADLIHGRAGGDRLAGGPGGDDLRGGAGRDRIAAGPGNDSINVRGGGRDRVACGGGRDRVRAGRHDRVARSCEHVRIR